MGAYVSAAIERCEYVKSSNIGASIHCHCRCHGYVWYILCLLFKKLSQFHRGNFSLCMLSALLLLLELFSVSRNITYSSIPSIQHHRKWSGMCEIAVGSSGNFAFHVTRTHLYCTYAKLKFSNLSEFNNISNISLNYASNSEWTFQGRFVSLIKVSTSRKKHFSIEILKWFPPSSFDRRRKVEGRRMNEAKIEEKKGCQNFLERSISSLFSAKSSCSSKLKHKTSSRRGRRPSEWLLMFHGN